MDMVIKTGDKLPSAIVTTMTSEGPSQIDLRDLVAGKKVVLFAVPGAFTPTCHAHHLPGFIANAEALKAKGVDMIGCISVNDVFVLDAWARQSGVDGEISFLADGNGDFTRAIGMQMDASAFGMGERSKRYAMIVDDGTVQAMFEEQAPSQAVESGAENILAALG